jgi:RND family efflux transporter MFP subunit
MKVIYLLGFAALSTGLLLTGCGNSASKVAPPVIPPVSVAHPIPRKVNEWDEFTGRLYSPETVEVRARVSGYIEKVHFKEGSDVKQGDLLFTIDQRPYQAVVDRLKAELGAARARAELAGGEAKRAEGLAATKAISTDTFETRLKTATEAAQSVLAAEAALQAAQLDLEFTEVRAPIAGRISNARVTAGNLITGGSTANATLLTTIVSFDPIYCYFDADEASVLRYRQLYREGKRVSALFEPIPAEMALGNEQGFPHKGRIDFVDNQLNPATGTIRARGVFPNADKLMSPGFFARVRIPGNGEYDAVLIRDSAIGSDQGRAFVLTVDDNDTATYRAIKPGPIIDGLRVVREGLKESDRVIVSGLMTARPGLHVQPQLVAMATNAPATTNSPVSSQR